MTSGNLDGAVEVLIKTIVKNGEEFEYDGYATHTPDFMSHIWQLAWGIDQGNPVVIADAMSALRNGE